MGISSKKSTTSNVQDTNSHATSTPNVPDWLLQPAQSLAGNLGGLIKQGSGAFTPQTSNLQTQAFDTAGTLSPSPLYGDAATAVKGAGPVQGQSLLDGLSSYYNPYKDQVLNPVLNDYDVNAGKTRAAQAAHAAGSGAFRGSRYGVQEGATEGELARGRASTEGGLLSDMYTQATGLSGQDAQRRQDAMTGNANRQLQQGMDLSGIADAAGSNDRANVGVQDLLGGQKTDQGNAQTQYPITFNNQLEGLFSGLDPSTFTGQSVDSTGHTTGTGSATGTPSTFDQIGKGVNLATQIAALFG